MKFVLRTSLRIVRAPENIPVFLGDKIRPGSMFAPVSCADLWEREPWRNKLRALLRRRWEPSQSHLQEMAISLFKREVVGGDGDFGPELMELLYERFSRDVDDEPLCKADAQKASALQTFTLTSQIRLGEMSPGGARLSLSIAEREPWLAFLIYPMERKVPIVSLKWFVSIDFTQTLLSIRKAGHACADDIISYLYEMLFLQQKTAIAIHEYFRLAGIVYESKRENAIINAEVDAIMQADLIFAYLKASIEKSMALLAVTYNIKGYDSRRRHQSRVSALLDGLPDYVKEAYYWSYVKEIITSELLEDVNTFRNGLLHKKGIADLQPHNYVDINPSDAPFNKISAVLMEQHSRNTAVFLCILALLTDSLVELNPDGDEEWFASRIVPLAEKTARKIYSRTHLDAFEGAS